MKTKAFFITLFLSCIVFLGNAQGSTENKVKEKVSYAIKKMDAAFTFEADKKANVEVILSDFYTEQLKLKNEIQRPASGLRQGLVQQNFQNIRKKNEDLIADREAKMQKALSEDQYKKWRDDIEPTLHSKRKK